MRIFKNAWFQRFAKREKITDTTLRDAIARAEKGVMDADLGVNVIKQRVARVNQGKSGGYRTIVVYRKGDRAFFVYGYAKSGQANIDPAETEAFKKAARELLALSDGPIRKLIENGALTEIKT